MELVRKLRRELHQHPELSNREVWTKHHLMTFLQTHTHLELVDRGAWFYAVYRAGEGKRNIAFRADFDALPIDETISLPHGSKIPGVSHKCGHDGHAASLCELALEVDQKGADHNIYFLFQHAEETGDGALECVPFLKENGIEEIFAFHNMSGLPLRSVNVIDGTAHYASKGMTIYMEGTPAHASQPEDGINPAFAIAELVQAIPHLTAPDTYEGKVLCTVIQVAVGERSFGVSASKGELLLTIRAQYEAELEQLQGALEQKALQLGHAHVLKVRFSYADEFSETVNHPESTAKIRAVCQRKGIPCLELAEPYRASEDFGHFLKETKGAIFYIGNGEDYPHIHTAAYDFNDEIIETAVEVFKGLAGCTKSGED